MLGIIKNYLYFKILEKVNEDLHKIYKRAMSVDVTDKFYIFANYHLFYKGNLKEMLKDLIKYHNVDEKTLEENFPEYLKNDLIVILNCLDAMFNNVEHSCDKLSYISRSFFREMIRGSYLPA